MQWDTFNAQAGFSTNPRTWLPVPPDYRTVNVQTETADPHSMLNWHKRLIALRRSSSALRSGRTVMLDRTNASVLTYARVDAHGGTIIVSLNMSPRPQSITLDAPAAGLSGTRYRTLLSSPGAIVDAAASQPIALPAFGAWVAALE
jgi:alpha-glucosidase